MADPYDTHDPSPALPCAAALVASTMSLMTIWADPCPNCALDLAAWRSKLARRIVENLFVLQVHPALSVEMCQVMALVHRRWVGLARVPAGDTAADAMADASATPTVAAAAKALH